MAGRGATAFDRKVTNPLVVARGDRPDNPTSSREVLADGELATGPFEGLCRLNDVRTSRTSGTAHADGTDSTTAIMPLSSWSRM